MKLATLKNASRDGALVVVSRDLSRYQKVPKIAATLQFALDHWDMVAERLQDVYLQLNDNATWDAQPFDQALCHSPLPRAYQWADGSAYINHVELVRKARNVDVPASFYTDPLMYQGGSDCFAGPRDPILALSEEWGIDLEAEVAVITADVAMGATKPASAFSPVCVTPDELGDAWKDSKVCLPLEVQVNRRPFGKPNAGDDMTFNFAQLVAHAAKTRELAPGTIIGSGTVSNKQGGLHGSSIDNGGVGYCCLAEVRMYETIEQGAPTTPFLKFGDSVRIEMMGSDGASMFGAIDQTVAPYQAGKP